MASVGFEADGAGADDDVLANEGETWRLPKVVATLKANAHPAMYRPRSAPQATASRFAYLSGMRMDQIVAAFDTRKSRHDADETPLSG